MANNISFRGEINEMGAAYFIREMESLPARSSATIYLHTPGGDIYAGGEMVNAMRSALKRGCKISLELGSLCASMGAALLAAARAAGCRAVCHPNSEVMFHGCWSLIIGGADELTDQAKAMRDFNECVRRDLKRCGIDDTEEWFAADRQKWLNADEMLALGLVDSISDSVSDDADDLKSDAVKIAAALNHSTTKENPKMDEPKNEPTETAPVEAAPVTENEATPTEAAPTEATPTEEAKAEEPAPAAPTEADIEAQVTALANQRFAGLQAKHDQMIAGLKNDVTNLTNERDAALADLTAHKAMVTSLQGDVEKLEHDLAECRDQLAKSESAREDRVVAALTPDTVNNDWAAKWRMVKGRQY